MVEQKLSQRLQALLLGHGGPGPALGLIGPVQVLQLRQGLGRFKLLFQLRGQLPLGLDGGCDGLPAFLEPPQVLEPGLQGPQRRVVHGAMELFPVAGDEGNGIADRKSVV